MSKKYPLLKYDVLSQLIPFLIWLFFIKDIIENLSDLLYFKYTLAIVVIYQIVRLWILYVVWKENLTTLKPYEKINPIIIIIASFLLFKDSSKESFIIAIFTAFILFIASIDIKTLKVSKTIGLYMWTRVLWAFWWLLSWYSLTKISAFELFFINAVFSFLLSLIICVIYYVFIKKEPILDKKADTKEIILRSVWPWCLWWWWWFISLVLIKDLWLTIATLLSFLSIAIWYIMYYIFLWEKPKKKDIILAVVVAFLVWLWYYLK